MPAASRVRSADKRKAQNPSKWQQQQQDDASSIAGSSEFDSVSNNGSCSGESEDQPGSTKERQTIPGMEASPDKQDKTRLRNERKHQRQKERKTKELKERCAGYLMQRKLGQLSQTLVGMGFPADRATAALTLNEGDVEKSITTLLDYERDNNFPKVDGVLKLDISQELAGLAEIETRLGIPLPDVERAVVSCEGDVDAAVRLLREQQQLQHSNTPQQQQRVNSLLSDPRLMLKQPAAAPVAVPPPPGWQRGPVMMHEAQLQQQQQQFYSMNHHHPAPTLLEHPKFMEQQQRERDLIADWRSSHPTQVMVNRVQRTLPHLKPQEQMFQQPLNLHHHLQQQQLYNQMMNPGPPSSPSPVAPAVKWSSSDSGGSWNVKGAPSVDYQAIDWSVGLPRSPFVKPMTSVSMNGSRNGMNEGAWSQVQAQNGLDLSQEWTSPFAGKDLFHHQPVHSL